MAETKKTKQEPRNLAIYEMARDVPTYALKTITAGRLKGMSDINPMYRIKKLTELFGPCGFGWRYEITKQWLETYGNEVKAFTNINLFVKLDGEWGEAIPGTGGSAFVAQERNGVYVNDEAYKMSLTDAISVATKALGVAADVYYAKDGKPMSPDDSKYQSFTNDANPVPQQQDELKKAISEITSVKSREQLDAVWKSYPQFHKNSEFLLHGSTMGKKYPK